MARFTQWTDPAVESALLGSLDIREPLALVGRFSSLQRQAGSEDERVAADYLLQRLAHWEVPTVRRDPHLYVSVPRGGADLRVITPAYARSMRCRIPAFAGATGDDPVEGDLLYVPADAGPPARGKVILTPGFPDAVRLQALQAAGALAVLFMQPGERVQEGTVASLSGAPDLNHAASRLQLPAGSVSQPDGLTLLEALARGPVTVRLRTFLSTGWVRCPVVISELRGRDEPEKFVLLHAYLDSWHTGAVPNTTGCAALLEIARVLAMHRDQLRRSVRLVWWSGYTQGAHGGAAWYADQYAVDLLENGIAHLACHAPGYGAASAYDQMPVYPALADLGGAAITAATGYPATCVRPGRGGDDAFMNLGLPGGFRRPPSLPSDLNTADPESLLRDTGIYLLAAIRLANAPVHPLDYRPVASEILQKLQGYQQAAGRRFNLGPALAEAQGLADDLVPFYAQVETLAAANPPPSAMARTNAALCGLGRALIPVEYTQGGWHQHDPVRELPLLPDLAPVQRLAGLPGGSDDERVVLTHLTRSRNRVVGALRQARSLVRHAWMEG